jgi:TrmH family RNA methyltransferase
MKPNDLRITSLQNDQVKNLVKLRNRRARDQQGLTIIEEPLVIARALEAGYPLETVYFCPEQLDAADQPLLEKLRQAASGPVIELSPPVMVKASYREDPEGLLVVAPQRKHQLADLELSRGAPLVILEAVEKPGNLGAILRIADGAGAAAVLLCGQGTDLFNPNVLRASRGAFFSVPTVAALTAEILEFCRQNGVTTVATSPAASSCYTATDLAGPIALVLGTEHEGLSDHLLAACDLKVSIPMLGTGDSLNVASSAAVLLYESLRQRSAHGA